MMTGGILRDRVRAPYCLAGAVTVTINVLGVLLLAVIFPLANDGSTASRLLVRIFGFTLAVEALALTMRSCTHKTVYSQFPTDRLIMLQVGIMLVPAILGRQLATQMPTSLGTVFLAVGLLFIELGMRYTLVKRDVALLSFLGRLCCCNLCAKCVHGKQGLAMAVSVFASMFLCATSKLKPIAERQRATTCSSSYVGCLHGSRCVCCCFVCPGGLAGAVQLLLT